MRSPMKTLFTQALGFSTPWRVVSVDFKPGEGLIAFQVESTAKRATCPVCGAGDQPIRDGLPLGHAEGCSELDEAVDCPMQ